MNDKDTLLDLIDEYAETRHANGNWLYNIKTADARHAVIEALGGVQALSAAQAEAPSPDVQAKINSNTWDHFGEILPTLKAISRGDWYWGANTRCKYIEIRIDTRDGGCILYDRDRVRISPEQFAHQSHPIGKMEPWPAAPLFAASPTPPAEQPAERVTHSMIDGLERGVELLETVQARLGEVSDRLASAEQPIGEVVVTKTRDGQIVSVTRQDDEGRILSVIATSGPAELQAAPKAAPPLPDGWTDCTIEFGNDGPEVVAYGPKRMMDRLAKWLGKYFAQVIADAAPKAAPGELEQLRERISKMGLDVDRAMRGHVNEQSPLGTQRLAAIAALAKPAPAPLSEREEIAMIDAAMVEMANIVPPLRRSECARLIHAAIAAQGCKQCNAT